MPKPMTPATFYVANTIRHQNILRETVGWFAQWAAPGMQPRYIMDGATEKIFPTEEEALQAARACLFDALNSRKRSSWKAEREFMGGNELSRLCGEIGIGPADFALIFGSRHDRVLDMFSGSREPPFSVWWALELFKTPSLLDKAKKIAREHTRDPRDEENHDVG
ncbi:hypothetical protein [Pleomorphomonas sp. PLEO]|uniref:hypothetical protein n=1 Tax=Pleomorphomonas sp. PLEO TaxID=3239306 RepID=UPI00351E9262